MHLVYQQINDLKCIGRYVFSIRMSVSTVYISIIHGHICVSVWCTFDAIL